MMVPKNVLYYGRPEPLPPQHLLRAGPLSLIYEAGDLRYICLGSIEVLRRVYSAVRDHNWGTVPAELLNEQVTAGEDSFHITFDAIHRRKDIDFFWQGEITGEPDGTVTYSMRGEARSTFRRNRIGFCVLHPMDCSGMPAKIEHADGSVEESAFPGLIAPQLVKDGHPWPVAPFDNLRALSHQVLPGLWAEVRFEGDVFEMEDQRNWTDASFKTYCTPLALPYPVEVKAGDRVAQSVRLSLHGPIPEELPGAGGEEIRISIQDGGEKPLPKIGLGAASHEHALTPQQVDRLKALNLSHLRLDLDLSDPAFTARLRRAAVEAASVGAQLEIALFLSDSAEDELASLRSAAAEIRPPVMHWLVFHQEEKTTSSRWVRLARQVLGDLTTGSPVGSGTNAYFTQLNAARPQMADMDLVAYSINPQVHAFDNASLTETLSCQAVTVASAKGFSGGKPVAVSPVTLRPRFNPSATGPESPPVTGELPRQVDARQSSLFGLAWTLGSIKYLAESGAASATFFETTGWRGVMELEQGAPLPEQFFSIPGGVYPLYYAFADVGEAAGGRVLPLRSSHPLLVDGLALEASGRRMLLLSNLTPHTRLVRLDRLPSAIKIRRINETNVLEAMQDPERVRHQPFETVETRGGEVHLEFMPYETVRIDMPG